MVMTMRLDLEHPSITEMNRKGFLGLISQPEHIGFDVYDQEILPGDSVVFDGDQPILYDNIERYLTDYYGFEFKTME